ncbi:MAG: NAD(P)-dependent oxidoreductase [Chloroflexi bacterium]|nr:NAD(P)-dependent oxidoreductase [Chloroflexota bacterium]
MRVGCIGLGNLGLPIAQRLMEAEFDLVVHNRSRAVVEGLVREGATAACSPRAVAEQVDYLVTALPFPSTVEEVYLDPDGIAEGARPGMVCIDVSTVRPSLSRLLVEALERRGVEFLDAPVSGGPEGARSGQLAIMVGGSQRAFEQARPVLDALGNLVVHCGPAGAGASLKLVNQVLIAIHSAAAAEAIALAERAGVVAGMALNVLTAGLGSSALLARNGARVLKSDFQPGARLGLFLKDLGLIRELCDELGADLPVFVRAKQPFEEAFNFGAGSDDLAGVIQLTRASLHGTRQSEGERAPVSQAAPQLKRPAVALNEPLDDGKPEPAASNW